MAKILIVDDDTKLLALYSAILKKEGYEVLTASEGKTGIDLAIANMPDMILLDVMMPSMEGGEVCETLQENTKTMNIPVVFLTSLVKEEEVEYGKGDIGGHEYISKSTPKDKLIARIKRILSEESR
ncbi:MAG: response regulator [Candidatus Omnitrophica bacterium]|nr:response regulator [Candidatus Omnitrophota bacterium]